MRPSLKRIERIEAYLQKTMKASEQKIFEQEMAKDKELANMVHHQRAMVETIRRKALRAEIQQAAKGGGSSGLNGSGKWIIGSVVFLAIIAASLFALLSPEAMNNTLEGSSESATVQHVDFNGLHMWTEPEIQVSAFSAQEGATIEGTDGTLIIVPENAFLDSLGNTVSGEVEVELIEALTLDKMVLYNLTTQSGSRPLQTGGMVHLSARKGGTELRVNPERPPLVQIPTDEVNPDMMQFKGVAKEDGTLDWQDPKPLEKVLVPIPFEELDFLPRGFEEVVTGLEPSSKYFASKRPEIENVFYSLSQCVMERVPLLPQQSSKRRPMSQANSAVELFAIPEMPTPEPVPQVAPVTNPVVGSLDALLTEMPAPEDSQSASDSSGTCGIDPLSIQSIRTKRFAKTFIATKAFESRIHALYAQESGEQLLNLYLRRIAEPLHETDAMVAQKVSGEATQTFQAFAAERYTNVDGIKIYAERLMEYYARKKKALRMTLQAKRQEIAAADKQTLESRLNKVAEDYDNIFNQISKPPQISSGANLAAPASQPAMNVATNQAYSFVWNAPGWTNIDCYLHLVQNNPKMLAISTDTAHSTAVVYQWLNTIKSLTPLYMKDSKAQAAFPQNGQAGSDLMRATYALSIAREDDRFWWGMTRFNPYEQSSVYVPIAETPLKEIKEKLMALDASNKGLADRLMTQKKEIEKRLERLKKQQLANARYNLRLQEAYRKYEEETLRILVAERQRIQQNNDDLLVLQEVISPCPISVSEADVTNAVGKDTTAAFDVIYLE